MSRYTVVDSPLGPITVTGDERGLTGVALQNGAKQPRAVDHLREDRALFQSAIEQLRAYFAGELRQFELTVHTAGATDFQQRVWRALQTIPFGQTASYRDIAEQIGAPRAVRAVGAANGKNPIAIVVPCHRVIGADGSLTGYAAGLDNKRWLLAHEARRAGRDLFTTD